MEVCKKYRDIEGRSGLQISASDGHQEIGIFLLSEGMTDDVEARETALHEACDGGYLEVVQTLLDAYRVEKSSYINKLDEHGRTPLMYALYSDVSLVELLFAPG